MNKKQKRLLARILIATAIVMGSIFLPIGVLAKALLAGGAYIVVGYDVLKKALRGALQGRPLDESFLMAAATIGAIGIAVYQKSGDFFEAVAVMIFYQVGELFQSYAAHKSRKSISELMDIRPDYANIEVDGALQRVRPEKVGVGNTIVVLPGERVPIDGIVIDGTSSLDTTALTGESIPHTVRENDKVVSGSVNMTAVLRIRTTKAFGDSTVSRILRLVEESGAHKAQTERFISRFARVYTPAVCIAALIVAIVFPLASLALSRAATWSVWIYRALTMLVISCPCALVLSVPLSFFAGIGGASREGILVKGADFIEVMAKINTVVFDKTGTLTKGSFEVSRVCGNGFDDKKLLEYAALAECSSLHPIAKSLVAAFDGEIDRRRVKETEEISGEGIVARVDGVLTGVGNEKLMRRLDVKVPCNINTGTVVHVATDGAYAGFIVISDKLKLTSKAAIKELRRAGVQRIVMLTGDVKAVAEEIAEEIGVDEVFSQLLPDGKVQRLEKILAESNKKTAFVGDGINDAPVLSRADIGIAMGALGSDAAIEAADIVLMEDDPLKISKAIRICRKCLGIVKQNIAFSLIVKFVCIVLGAIGVANMWIAVFADVGVMIIAVINAVRSLRVRKV